MFPGDFLATLLKTNKVTELMGKPSRKWTEGHDQENYPFKDLEVEANRLMFLFLALHFLSSSLNRLPW